MAARTPPDSGCETSTSRPGHRSHGPMGVSQPARGSRHRPSRKIGIGRPPADRTSWPGPNPSLPEDRRGQVVRRAGVAARGHPALVGRAVDGTAGNPAAGQEHGHRPRPVVAPGRAVDPRRPAELPGADDDRLVQQPARVQVADQGGEGPVQRRQEAVAERPEVVAVRVPAADAQRHEPGAGLDQPPGGERPLAQRRPAVGVAERLRLARQVEGGPDAVGVEELQRLAMEAVQARQRLGRLQRPQAAVEPVAAAPRAPPGRAGENPPGSDTPCAWKAPRTGSPSTSNGPYAGPR